MTTESRRLPFAFAAFGLPDSWDVGHAYSGRNGGNPTGGFHLIVGSDFKAGRIRRKRGDALCGKRFYNLDWGRKSHAVTCKRCIALANSVTKYQLEEPAEPRNDSDTCECGNRKPERADYCRACVMADEREEER